MNNSTGKGSTPSTGLIAGFTARIHSIPDAILGDLTSQAYQDATAWLARKANSGSSGDHPARQE